MTTTAPTPASARRRARARWGDREGRRRDILDAARNQMRRAGYLGLNMRDIAAGAAVSPGTLYQYFSTKEEIFATLYAEAIEAHNERITPLCDAASDLEDFLRELATAYLDLYSDYGRYFTMWSALRDDARSEDGPFPPQLTLALREATLAQARLIRGALERLAPPRDRRLLHRSEALTFIWASLNGLADHLTSERHRLTGIDADQLTAFTARVLAIGLQAPA